MSSAGAGAASTGGAPGFTTPPGAGPPAGQLLELVGEFTCDGDIHGACAHGDGYLFGTAQGTVIVAIPPAAEGNAWTVTQPSAAISKKPVSDFAVCTFSTGANGEEEERLLAITDEGVTAFSLPELSLKGQAFRTQKSLAFAWDAKGSRLAVAKANNKVEFFRYQRNEFTSYAEQGIPEGASAMSWMGDVVLVCTAQSLSVVRPNAKTRDEMRWRRKAPAVASFATEARSAFVLQNGSTFFYHGDDNAVDGPKSLPPQVATGGAMNGVLNTPPSYILISDDHRVHAYLASYELAPSCLQSLEAPEPPSESGGWGRRKGPPGGLPALIMVHTQASKRVMVVRRGGRRVGVMQFGPIDAQVAAVRSMGTVREALHVCGELDFPGRTDLEAQLHIQLGVELCDDGDFDEGLSEIATSATRQPLALLQYYPDLVLNPAVQIQALDPRHISRHAERLAAGEDFPELATASSIRLVTALSRQTTATERESVAASAAPSEDGAGSAGAAAGAPGGAAGGGRFVKPDIGEVLPYLVTYRSRLLVQVGEMAEDEEGPSSLLPMVRAAQEVVDVALMLGWAKARDYVALQQLLRAPNSIDVPSGQKALQAHGLYYEEIVLLEANDRHDVAMERFRELCLQPDELAPAPAGAAAGLVGDGGTSEALAYLNRLPTCEADTARLLSCLEDWLFEVAPGGSLDLLLNHEPRIPPAAALLSLQKSAPALAAPYLEAAIQSGLAEPQKFDQELALQYLRILSDSSGPGSSAAAMDATASPGSVGLPMPPSLAQAASMAPSAADAEAKLLQLVHTSQHVDPQVLLRRISGGPKGVPLARVAAALQEELGQYEEAMDVYVTELHDWTLAEAFADRMYERLAGFVPDTGSSWRQEHAATSIPGVNAAADVYRWLLRLLLQPRAAASAPGSAVSSSPLTAVYADGSEAPPGAAAATSTVPVESVNRALLLIGRKWDRLDMAASLAVLPKDVKLGAIGESLNNVLIGLSRHSKDRSLQKSLLTAEKTNLIQEKYRLEAQSMLVTNSTRCVVCAGQLFFQARVITPQLEVMHEKCYRTQQAGENPEGRVLDRTYSQLQ